MGYININRHVPILIMTRVIDAQDQVVSTCPVLQDLQQEI